jgi:hypothetical protein
MSYDHISSNVTRMREGFARRYDKTAGGNDMSINPDVKRVDIFLFILSSICVPNPATSW